MATALMMTVSLSWAKPFSGNSTVTFAKTALATTLVTTVVWLIVTLATGPEPQEVLLKFYRAVRPHVDGWKPIAKLVPEITPTRVIWAVICFRGSWAAPWCTWHCSALDTCSCFSTRRGLCSWFSR